MKIYKSLSPSKNYLEALKDIWVNGDTLIARGKAIKEIRPVVIENKFAIPFIYIPYRKNNAFFSIFESSFWIPAGRYDVETLALFNSNMKQFSDDGITFNAPYGERIRSWGANGYRNYEPEVIPTNPIDQLKDVVEKLKADPFTRQATMIIANPHFDNFEYTSQGGKDIACNIAVSFKYRNGKLDITVFNRSNDLIYGALGANITQFVTLQNIVAGMLGMEVGTYTHITDSLHVYTEDFGVNILDKTLPYALDSNYKVPEYFLKNSARPKISYEETMEILERFFEKDLEKMKKCEFFEEIEYSLPTDQYWKNCYLAMIAYFYHKNGDFDKVVEVMTAMSRSYEKMACAIWLWETQKYNNYDYFISMFDIPRDVRFFKGVIRYDYR